VLPSVEYLYLRAAATLKVGNFNLFLFSWL
jgi:hypothetical protein